MFKYNELSDLLTGELVTPLRMDENDNIICLNKNNEEVIYTFDDFDFDKTPEERIFIVDDTANEEPEENQATTEPSEPEDSTTEPEDSTTEPETSETENNNEEITEPEQIPEEPQNDEEEITEPIQEEPKPEKPVQKKSGWIEDENEKAELLFSLGYNISSLKKINIYRDNVI